MLAASPRFILSIDSSLARNARRSPPVASSFRNASRSSSVMKARRRQNFMMLPWKACGSEQKYVAMGSSLVRPDCRGDDSLPIRFPAIVSVRREWYIADLPGAPGRDLAPPPLQLYDATGASKVRRRTMPGSGVSRDERLEAEDGEGRPSPGRATGGDPAGPAQRRLRRDVPIPAPGGLGRRRQGRVGRESGGPDRGHPVRPFRTSRPS